MKTAIQLSLILGVSFISMVSLAGGGGDVIVLPNDQVVLADPFLDSGAPQPNNMPPLRALNPRILQAIALYSKAIGPVLLEVAPTNNSDVQVELQKLSVRENNLRFYAVQSSQELAVFCAPGGRKSYTLPDGASVQSVACTAGDETFLVEPTFLRLSLRDQALLLIHERLTTLRDKYGGKNYSAIARFTSSLNVYLDVAREQSYQKYRMLTDLETKRLTDLYIAAEEIERRNSNVTDSSFMMVSHPFGGGRVHSDSMVSPQALVTLRSRIGQGSVIGDGAQIIDSDLDKGTRVGANSMIRISNLGPQVRVGSGVVINNSRIQDVVVGANTSIDSSNIKDNSQIGENVTIANANLTASNLEGANKVMGTSSYYVTLNLSRGAGVQNLLTSPNMTIKLGAGSTVSDSTLAQNAGRNGSGTIVIGAMSSVKSTELYSVNWISGDNTQIDSSVLLASTLKAGRNLNLQRVHITADIIGLGDDQRLADGNVTNDSLNYAPKGYSLKQININFQSKEYAFESTLEDYWKKFNGNFYVTTSKNIAVKADYAGEGKRKGIFSSSFAVNLDPFKIQLWVTSANQENTDDTLYTVWAGSFAKAGLNTAATINCDLPLFLMKGANYYYNPTPTFYNGIVQGLMDNSLEIVSYDKNKYVVTFRIPAFKAVGK